MAAAELRNLDDEAFRAVARAWLTKHVVGEFAELHGRGGPGDEDVGFETRVRWEHLLGEAGWIGIGWPVSHGGHGVTIAQQIIWAEEYTLAEAPTRVNHMGENLLAPTLIAYGTPAQCARFLPGIRSGTQRWCQGYSEPGAGSDLANVQTRARRDGDEWVIDGQKVWTSLAHVCQWCFVVARTEPGSQRHHGLSFLLVPMDQPGVEARPIRQMTGGGEFCETFFTAARTEAALTVGEPGKGWAVAMALLGFERGVSTLAQQIGFERELDRVIAHARASGADRDRVVRQRLATAYSGLQLMRWNARRSMGSGVPGPEASISKLFWGTWHRQLGETMIDVLGAAGTAGPPGTAGGPDGDDERLTVDQKLFLFTRADTIYGGSNEIQRNVVAERVLGLPRA